MGLSVSFTAPFSSITTFAPAPRYLIESDQDLSQDAMTALSEAVKRWDAGDLTALVLGPGVRLRDMTSHAVLSEPMMELSAVAGPPWWTPVAYYLAGAVSVGVGVLAGMAIP